jgi:hypothetical protein
LIQRTPPWNLPVLYMIWCRRHRNTTMAGRVTFR